MGAGWSDTVVVVISEFGRTFRENGNRGTDHGHGTVYWVLGGSVRGGRVGGEEVRVERAALLPDPGHPGLHENPPVLDAFAARPVRLRRTRAPEAVPRR